MKASIVKPAAIATLVSGTLDIGFAMILTIAFGRRIPDMLRFVASGPFPAATDWGSAGAALGLAVHFTLMAIMAAVFVLAARRLPALVERPSLAGVGYGLVTYVAMNWIVVPLRFDLPLPTKPISIASQLFAHLALVGIPIALIAARTLRPSPVAEPSTA